MTAALLQHTHVAVRACGAERQRQLQRNMTPPPQAHSAAWRAKQRSMRQAMGSGKNGQRAAAADAPASGRGRSCTANESLYFHTAGQQGRRGGCSWRPAAVRPAPPSLLTQRFSSRNWSREQSNLSSQLSVLKSPSQFHLHTGPWMRRAPAGG